MKKILKNSILIFLLCIVIYILSLFLKFSILRIVMPINKTLFSYFKMIFTAEFLFCLFDKKRDKYFKCIVRSSITILSQLILYVLTYFYISNNIFFIFIITFISIFIGEFITSKIKKYQNFYKHLSITCIVIIYYLFLYFTDKPLNNFIFTYIK